MKRALASCFAVLLLVASCTSGPKRYVLKDLPNLVLQAEDAPIGTSYDSQDSGPQDLTQFAGGDKAKADAFRTAGFEGAYFTQFVSPGITGSTSQSAQLAVSFALLFPDVSHARKGLDALKADVKRRGSDLTDRPDPKIGDGSFSMYGTLRVGVPPGYLYAWRLHNGVFGMIAAGNVDDTAVLVLAQKMVARER